MNKYEEKQALRKARHAEKAEKFRQESDEVYQQARKMAEVIPFGQPILVGHYSETRDRNYRKRINRLDDKAHELSKKAGYYEEKANTQSNAISSDDSDAISKLEEKLKALEADQERMKEINRLYKLEGEGILEKLSDAEKSAVLANLQVWQSKPFPSYCLTNNNQNIHRIKQRIESLQRLQQAPERKSIQDDVQGNGFILKEDKTDNRILFVFDEKPTPEIRAILKRHAFKWSPTRSAWIRQLNANGRSAAVSVLEKSKELKG